MITSLRIGFAIAALLFSAGLLFFFGFAPITQSVEPGDCYQSITAERLTGATLRQIGGKPGLVWHFGVTRFRLDLDKKPPDEWVRRLASTGAGISRIEGQWRYEARKSQLVLYDLAIKDAEDLPSIVMPIRPAGLLRADLGDRQYSINELDVRGKWKSLEKNREVVWTFEFDPHIRRENPFTIQCENGELPKSITSALLDRPEETSKIEGKWKFDRFTKRLQLSKLTPGTCEQAKPIVVSIEVVDVLTIELPGGRYCRVE
jgi:hypothetical protein